MDVDFVAFEYFILVFARLASMVAFSPIIGSGSVPVTVKTGFSFLLSIIVFPIVSRNFPMLPATEGAYWILVGREVMIGILIGVVGNLMFSAVQLSGQIFGIQVGFGIVNVIDPMSEEQISILGQFEFILAVLIFLSINGHHVLLRLIMESYQILPMNSFFFSESLGYSVVGWLSKMFIIAFKIGLPVIFTLLLVTVSMGILARTVPQMNVFIVGLPIQIFVGLFVLGASFSLLTFLLRGYFDMMFHDMYFMMKTAISGG